MKLEAPGDQRSPGAFFLGTVVETAVALKQVDRHVACRIGSESFVVRVSGRPAGVPPNTGDDPRCSTSLFGADSCLGSIGDRVRGGRGRRLCRTMSAVSR